MKPIRRLLKALWGRRRYPLAPAKSSADYWQDAYDVDLD